MSTGKRIKDRRKELGMNAESLALACGVSPATIYRYEKGDIENMGIDKLGPIADALHTTPAFLMGWEDDPTDYDDPDLVASIPDSYLELFNGDVRKSLEFMRALDEEAVQELTQNRLPSDASPIDFPSLHRIPILGRIAAGRPVYAEENIEGYTYTDLNSGAEYFALRVRGDSMNAARINDGDIVIVRQQETVDNGQIAVVQVGDDEATLKRFRQDGYLITLTPQSTNPVHQPLVFDARRTKVRVLGLVVKVEFSPI